MSMKTSYFRWTRVIAALCFMLISVLFPFSIHAAGTDSQAEDGALTNVSFDDLAGKTAGVLTGTPQDEFVKAKVKDPNLLYFNNITDLAVALGENKIDYYVNSTISYRIMKDTYPDFAYADAVFKSFDIGTIFSKDENGEKLQGEMNEYISKIKADGTLDQLKEYWLNPNDWKEVDIPSEGVNGTLEMGAISTMKPFCFVIGEGYGGLDTAVIAGFCQEYGYGLNIDNVDFSGALSGVSSGKYDLAAGQISYTDERAESVLYSDFYCSQDIVPIVRKADYASGSGTQNSSGTDSAVKSSSTTGSSLQSSSLSAKGSEDGALDDVTLDALAGKTAGVLTGTPQDGFVKDAIKDPEFLYYDSFTDECVALQEGKIDYLINSTISFRMMQETYPEFSYINSSLKSLDIGTIFPQTDEGKELQGKLNEYLAEIKENGTLDKLQNYWLYPNDWEEVSIPTDGENGTLTMAGISTMKPFCFVLNDGFGGLDTAIIAGFCEEYGYGLQIENVDFSGALSGVSSGKFDLAAGQISWTQERAESVLYSDFYAEQEIVPFVRTADYTSDSAAGTDDTVVSSSASADQKDNSFLGSLKRSFYRTLIQENRYRSILSGLGVTLIITLFGFLLANLFGALFCAMAMSKSRILRVIADIYSRIMQGTPVVVILMILYYIIFTGKHVSGVFVAIVGFGITSGAYLAQLFQGGIRSVDRGQSEAALAIGFTPFQTFNGIVLPQAVRNILPGYFSQLISLMKGTAIVGYIAVVDLTKAGDIIRGNTFEPFLPLIIVAVIYFLIACILLSVLKQIQKKLSPKRVKPEKGGTDK